MSDERSFLKAWFTCDGCDQPKPLFGSEVRLGIRRCAECTSLLPQSKHEYQRSLVIARAERKQQEAYRRGFEDGWRESKLEEMKT